MGSLSCLTPFPQCYVLFCAAYIHHLLGAPFIPPYKPRRDENTDFGADATIFLLTLLFSPGVMLCDMMSEVYLTLAYPEISGYQ